MDTAEFNEKAVQNYLYEINAHRAHEMRVISQHYKIGELEEERNLSKTYDELMIDYRYLSHKYFILLNPKPGEQKESFNLKKTYEEISRKHKELAEDHQNVLNKLNFDEYFNRVHKNLNEQWAKAALDWSNKL